MIAWSRDRLLVRDLASGGAFLADVQLLSVLDVFGRPLSESAAVRALPQYAPDDVRRAVRELRKRGLLLPASQAKRRQSRIEAWKANLASAFYHAASRDLRYVQDPSEVNALLPRLLAGQRPLQFKRYGGRERLPLSVVTSEEAPAPLGRVLSARRTIREFDDRPVPLVDLAAVVRGTWGQTGWLDSGPMGRLPTRTSPSGGAMHPIECYVLSWNVRGLPAGVYHYDVPDDALVCLKSGSPRAAAVRAASGQKWIGGAAFLCIMTAVFERTLWKYELENAYRTVWYEAGHLGQTFALLATAHGLGAFATAAMQDSFIERLLGLDGIREFPVYLCGAGVPDPARRFPKWSPIERAKRRRVKIPKD